MGHSDHGNTYTYTWWGTPTVALRIHIHRNLNDGEVRQWHFMYVCMKTQTRQDLVRECVEVLVDVERNDGELRPWHYMYVYMETQTTTYTYT